MQFPYEKRVRGWGLDLGSDSVALALAQTSLDNSLNLSETHFIICKMKVLDQMIHIIPSTHSISWFY